MMSNLSHLGFIVLISCLVLIVAAASDFSFNKFLVLFCELKCTNSECTLAIMVQDITSARQCHHPEPQ
jgi:hypothetical protein